MHKKGTALSVAFAESGKSLFRNILHVTPLSLIFCGSKGIGFGIKSNGIKILRSLIQKSERSLRNVAARRARSVSRHPLTSASHEFSSSRLRTPTIHSCRSRDVAKFDPTLSPLLPSYVCPLLPARSASGKPDCPLIRPARGHFIATEL